MKVAIYIRQPTEPHQEVAKAVLAGIEKSGDKVWDFGNGSLAGGSGADQPEADVVVIFGIGGAAKQVWDANPQARRILLDKPYVRGGVPNPKRYYLCRVSIDAPQPLAYFQKIPRKSSRWDRMKLFPKPYAVDSLNTHILLDGASNKYCLWNNLPSWSEWGQQMIGLICQHTNRPIIYRPRPSNNNAPIVDGAELSERPLVEDLARARIVVSHGGNIGFDAVFAGVPHFAINCSIARPLSETNWSKVGESFTPTYAARTQWFHDLAYCQWNLDEFADGSAWRYCRETMEVLDVAP